MQDDQLPLVDAVDEQRFAVAFEEHNVEFGTDDEVVYSPAITLWALLSQVFYSSEMRSCKAAVARVASLWAALGRAVCNTNTGAYCRARAKIPFEALRAITKRLASDAEAWSDEQGRGSEKLSSEQREARLTPSVVAQVKAQPVGDRNGFSTFGKNNRTGRGRSLI